MYVNDTYSKIVRSQDDEKRPCPPPSVLDRIADEKFAPGYKGAQRSRKNVCPDCYEARSIAKTCGC
jgi:hypothetical protein